MLRLELLGVCPFIANERAHVCTGEVKSNRTDVRIRKQFAVGVGVVELEYPLEEEWLRFDAFHYESSCSSFDYPKSKTALTAGFADVVLPYNVCLPGSLSETIPKLMRNSRQLNGWKSPTTCRSTS